MTRLQEGEAPLFQSGAVDTFDAPPAATSAEIDAFLGAWIDAMKPLQVVKLRMPL